VSYVAAGYLIQLPSLPSDLVHCPSLIKSTLILRQSEEDKSDENQIKVEHEKEKEEEMP
jgi:hypothetical protein